MLPRKRNSADKNGSIREAEPHPKFSPQRWTFAQLFGLIERNPLMISRASYAG